MPLPNTLTPTLLLLPLSRTLAPTLYYKCRMEGREEEGKGVR